MKFAYVKSGNTLKEYAAHRDPTHPGQSGPEGYLPQLLSVLDQVPGLLISTGEPPEAAAQPGAPLHLRGVGGAGSVRRACRIFTALLRERPDVIICGEPSLALAASTLAATLLRATLIFSSHNDLEARRPTARQRLQARLNAFCLRRAAACVCHGPFLTDQLARIRGGQQGLFPFDRGTQLPDQCAAPDPDGPRNVLYLGRVETDKGAFDLLEAMTPLLRDLEQPRLVYVGGGGGLADLEAEIRKRGLTDRVTLAGHAPHRDVARYLAQAWVTATPTRTSFPEGRCMTAVESLDCGVPVVAPRFGPFAFFIRHEEAGLLHEPDSVTDLRRQLERVLLDADLRERLSKTALQTRAQRTGPDDFPSALAKALRFAGFALKDNTKDNA
ncbi:Glycosyltransferase involved in cell wall bisynthesis [Paucidesulfovibrio gracilis DSM 16080]|uniref:Glycosyltransferase involved in cell wall bisynthesis n=1 Tax=Paucidesulfovibrio gracilis DSM 16080 TaxID=1121449 RepID=A0A1T4XDQ4_9BACT|nr:glycosyltransferase family 4 protein [Paucidesulfovibrio gracilis]SKA87693.1 Glycosyltransferase involved in cell wall bisynthesis [Paucidesulfovibrio gracilis DSM 16080]